MEQNDNNDDTSNVITEFPQDDPNLDNPDISNAYDFNDGQDLTQQKIETMVNVTLFLFLLLFEKTLNHKYVFVAEILIFNNVSII